MSPQLAGLQSKLREIFEFDHAEDLDFGIYRILNLKREQTTLFLNELLEKYVKDAFKPFEDKTKARILAELEELEKKAATMGIKPQDSPKYQEKQKQLLSAVDTQKTENEVYAHLAEFFGRYYDSGDFISLRRYKKDVYAIPYEGEEVKLHWANADQYYIKTTEYLSNYGFVVGGKKASFKFVNVDADPSANNKVSKEKERVFRLAENAVGIADAVGGEASGLHIYFTFEAKRSKDETQAKLLDEALETLKSNHIIINKYPELLAPAPTEKNKSRTVLEKHLTQYTARNSRDFFIHKNLEKFLSQELDFYLKNEVMFIDDLDTEKEVDVQVYLSKVKVIKRIGLKIIAMLAQVENFQKRLWLKKKFVLQSDWCFTLDRVPESYYPEILKNQKQIQAWIKLFWIQEIETSKAKDLYSKDTTGFAEVFDKDGNLLSGKEGIGIKFLKENQNLLLDTVFFIPNFKYQLLADQDNLDEKTDGLLVHSENFQALRLLENRYRSEVNLVYIDPPYNTGSDDFIYKDSYQESSWVSLISDRLKGLSFLLNESATINISIGEFARSILEDLLKSDFNYNKITSLIWNRNHSAQAGYYLDYHEYVLVYTASQNPESPKKFADGIIEAGAQKSVTNRHKPQEFTFPAGTRWDAEEGKILLGRWGAAEWTELIEGEMVCEDGKLKYNVVLRAAWTQLNQMKNFFDGKEVIDTKGQKVISFFFNSSGKLKYQKERNQEKLTSIISNAGSANAATNYLSNILGKVYPHTPKSIKLISDIIDYQSDNSDLIFDYFGGSGTTGHAVIDLNREDQDSYRKYILVEMGEYFDSVTKPRIQKVVYSPDWKDGKPTSRNKPFSHAFKYLRLESYEDTLTNLAEAGAQLAPSTQQQALLAKSPALKEDYLLRYALDLESREPLLPQFLFDRPWDAKLSCTRDNAVIENPIDMPETFNYLLGLVVRNVRMSSAKNAEGISCPVYAVEGQTLSGQQVLVLWRNLVGTDALDSLSLNTWFQKMYDLPKRTDFDVIYVNGDTLLPNVKFTQSEQPARFKVNLLESEFARLMWEGTD